MTTRDRLALNQILIAARLAVGDDPAEVIAALVGAIATTANRTASPWNTVVAASEEMQEMVAKAMQKRSGR